MADPFTIRLIFAPPKKKKSKSLTSHRVEGIIDPLGSHGSQRSSSNEDKEYWKKHGWNPREEKFKTFLKRKRTMNSRNLGL